MSQHIFATLAGLALAAAPSLAETASGDEILLKAGDPAPALSVETWVKGEPVAAFEPGKLYVVEFWATWCGPCIQSMPHLTEIQSQYRDKGLTVVAVTSEDPNNSFEQVQKMVEEKGDGMAYTVAWDKERETSTAFMKAAQQKGIPCSFVVDGTGTVAYIGHPMWLDIVLEGVVAGTWDVVKGREEVAEAEAQLQEVFQFAGNEPAKALELLKAFAAAHPAVAKMFKTLQFSLLLETGNLDEGYAFGRELVAEAIANKDFNTLIGIAAQIVDPEQKLERRDVVLAEKAAKMANQITEGENPWALMTLARVHSLKGEHEAAIKLQEKAVSLSDDERMTEYLQGVLDELKAAAGQ